MGPSERPSHPESFEIPEDFLMTLPWPRQPRELKQWQLSEMEISFDTWFLFLYKNYNIWLYLSYFFYTAYPLPEGWKGTFLKLDHHWVSKALFQYSATKEIPLLNLGKVNGFIHPNLRWYLPHHQPLTVLHSTAVSLDVKETGPLN